MAIITSDGTVLLDTLVNPLAPISPAAQATHRISAEAVAAAPTFAALEPTIRALLHGRQVAAYNAPFDRGIFHSEIARLHHEAGAPAAHRAAAAWCRAVRWAAVMVPFAAFCGEWSDYHGDYRWQPLPCGDHSALGDARACLAVIRAMAGECRLGDRPELATAGGDVAPR